MKCVGILLHWVWISAHHPPPWQTLHLFLSVFVLSFHRIKKITSQFFPEVTSLTRCAHFFLDFLTVSSLCLFTGSVSSAHAQLKLHLVSAHNLFNKICFVSGFTGKQGNIGNIFPGSRAVGSKSKPSRWPEIGKWLLPGVRPPMRSQTTAATEVRTEPRNFRKVALNGMIYPQTT